MSYSLFVSAFGMEINWVDIPLLLHLLDRIVQDVQTVAFSAKSFYNRPRPYQRFQMEHVCGAEKAPAPDVPLRGGSSYPSGHTSFGWATVLILAEIVPEHAQPLLARGREYGESRIVCAVHYPSDIEGGQLVATAVVARLHADPEFKRDLACAKEERSVALHPGEELSHTCRQREAQLARIQAPTVEPLPIIPGSVVLVMLWPPMILQNEHPYVIEILRRIFVLSGETCRFDRRRNPSLTAGETHPSRRIARVQRARQRNSAASCGVTKGSDSDGLIIHASRGGREAGALFRHDHAYRVDFGSSNVH